MTVQVVDPDIGVTVFLEPLPLLVGLDIDTERGSFQMLLTDPLGRLTPGERVGGGRRSELRRAGGTPRDTATTIVRVRAFICALPCITSRHSGATWKSMKDQPSS